MGEGKSDVREMKSQVWNTSLGWATSQEIQVYLQQEERECIHWKKNGYRPRLSEAIATLRWQVNLCGPEITRVA